MASDINKTILFGRLVRDPELKTTTSGMTFAKFTLASNRTSYNKETKEKKESAGFFDCILWGKSAEVLCQYTKKGSKLLVDGSLAFSSWENSEGKKQSKVEILVQNFQFMDSKEPGASVNQQPVMGVNVQNEFQGQKMTDDEIPF